MRNNVILLIVIILLYLVPSLILSAVYGPSYGFLSGEDCWVPDGQGGWLQHGQPAEPAPSESSMNVPFTIRYLPIFLPALVLILFLFTPLSKMLENGKKKEVPAPGEPVYEEMDTEAGAPDESDSPGGESNRQG